MELITDIKCECGKDLEIQVFEFGANRFGYVISCPTCKVIDQWTCSAKFTHDELVKYRGTCFHARRIISNRNRNVDDIISDVSMRAAYENGIYFYPNEEYRMKG